MANAYKGEVAFEADGKAYTASFNANLMASLKTAISKEELDRVMGGDAGAADVMRKLFWLSLKKHHPEIDSEDMAGDLVGYFELLGIVQRGMILAVAGPEGLRKFEAALEVDGAQPHPQGPDHGKSNGPASSAGGAN